MTLAAMAGSGCSMPFLKRFVGGVGLTVQVPEPTRVAVVFGPLLNAVRAQEVAVILEQFAEARLGHASQKDFGLLGCPGSVAAFLDVLLSRPRGLHHLVDGAVALLQEAPAKAHGAVVDNAGFLKGKEVFVASVRRNEMFTGHKVPFQGPKGHKGQKGINPKSFVVYVPLVLRGSGNSKSYVISQRGLLKGGETPPEPAGEDACATRGAELFGVVCEEFEAAGVVDDDAFFEVAGLEGFVEFAGIKSGFPKPQSDDGLSSSW
jgi:hypothetical protein